jgi:hypothetical protein
MCSSSVLQVSTSVVIDVAFLLVVVAVFVLLLVLFRFSPLFYESLRKPDITMDRQPFTEISSKTHGKFHEHKLANISICKPSDEKRTSRFYTIPLC